MDPSPQLIEEITRLVMEALERPQTSALPAVPPSLRVPSAALLAVGCEGPPVRSPGWSPEAFDALRAALPGIGWSVVRPSRSVLRKWTSADVRLMDTDDASVGEALARDYAGLLLPQATLAFLARLSLLQTDDVAVNAVVQFRILNKPVWVGTDDVQFLVTHEAQLPKGLADTVRSHLRVAQGLGLQVGPLAELPAAIQRALSGGGPLQLERSGRPVVTREDVEEMRRQGRTTVHLSMGTIVTSLAWEAARSFGIELKVQ